MQTPIYRATPSMRKTLRLNPAQWLTILLVLTAGFVTSGTLLGGGIATPAQPDAIVQPIIERQHPLQTATPATGGGGTRVITPFTPGATSQPPPLSPTSVVLGDGGVEAGNKSG